MEESFFVGFFVQTEKWLVQKKDLRSLLPWRCEMEAWEVTAFQPVSILSGLVNRYTKSQNNHNLPLDFSWHFGEWCQVCALQNPWNCQALFVPRETVTVRLCAYALSCSVVFASLRPHGSPPGFSVHRNSQAIILEWVSISFSSESFWPRGWTHVSCIVGGFFTA